MTTISNTDSPVAPNLLNRDFSADAPNRKWVSDISYIFTQEGWLYLAVILDLFSRRVVGWSMKDHMRTELVLDALEMAINNRRPKAGLTFHSDRGCQYTSDDFQRALAAHGMIPSMSRRGDCWDNAVAESFFGSFKVEALPEWPYRTRSEAQIDAFQYIEGFYNRHRLHSYLDYQTPAGFEGEAA